MSRNLQLAAKRALDIVVSLIGLILLSPLLLLIAIAIYVKMGRPVLFRHKRPGLNGLSFVLYKFRTMIERNDDAGNLAPDEERVIPFGQFLRETSLDELPELWNVLRGDMSLVGPRPLLPQYLNRYNSEQRKRHNVKPGITGWAQVNGRNALSWEDRFDLDLWYINHWNFLLDLKILVRTLVTIVKREGISQQGHVSMPEFLGTKHDEGDSGS
jgi:sugar transferase EpsL